MDQSKNRSFYIRTLITFAITGSFFVGIYIGHTQVSEVSKVQGITNVEAGKPSDADFALFWKAWNVLNEKYAAGKTPVSNQDKIYGAVKGLAASMGDPYTVFFPPVESKSFQSEISGNFEGVGMEVGIQDLSLIHI